MNLFSSGWLSCSSANILKYAFDGTPLNKISIIFEQPHSILFFRLTKELQIFPDEQDNQTVLNNFIASWPFGKVQYLFVPTWYFMQRADITLPYPLASTSLPEILRNREIQIGRPGAHFRSKKIVTKIVMRIVMRSNFDSEICLNFSSHEFFK